MRCRRQRLLLGWLLICIWFTADAGGFPIPSDLLNPDAPAQFECQVVHSIPHRSDAFTQGLAFGDGQLYEGTGLKGHSSLRQIEPATGRVVRIHHLPSRFFGEGITLWGPDLIQLTWKSQRGFIYRRQDFKLLRSFYWPRQGWGITHDGQQWIISDGSQHLFFVSPQTQTTERMLAVTDRGQPVANLNELEYIQKRIFANVWQTARIAVISPQTGAIEAWIDLKGLPRREVRAVAPGTANGIAYDPDGDRLFVTGKHWPHVYQVRLRPSAAAPPHLP